MRMATKSCNTQTFPERDTCCEASGRPCGRAAAPSRPAPRRPRITNLARSARQAVVSPVRSRPENNPPQAHRVDAATSWPVRPCVEAVNRLKRRFWNCRWRYALCLLPALCLQGPVLATGTGAGTSISNTATTDYVIAGNGSTISSNTVTLRVDEKLDMNLAWQDAGNVSVNTPDNDRVMSYLLTNTGNGNDSYTLGVQNSLGGDQFDPVFVDIYLDANGDGIFNPGTDIPYSAGINDPALDADASLAIFVRNTIPAGLNNGDLGDNRLTATSRTGSGLPGTAFANAGDNGTTAVVGTSGGTDNTTGTYAVSGTSIALLKSVVIADPSGGTRPVPGATMTYSIDASAAGTATASGVVITDPLPANTTYSAGTLSLNAAPLTDGADADAGDVGGTTPNTVTVYLGDLTPASPVQTIAFEVIIN